MCVHVRSVAGGVAALSALAASSAIKCDFAMRPTDGILTGPVSDAARRSKVQGRGDRFPTEAEILEINTRHLIATPLKPADLLFVFGTRVDVRHRVDEAFRLWR